MSSQSIRQSVHSFIHPFFHADGDVRVLDSQRRKGTLVSKVQSTVLASSSMLVLGMYCFLCAKTPNRFSNDLSDSQIITKATKSNAG